MVIDLLSVGRRCSYIDGCCILYRALYMMLIIVFEIFVTLFFFLSPSIR